MFQRRNKLHPIKRLWGLVWPSSGWRRSSRYYFHRVARISGTPYSIAAGFSVGAAVSFTPFVGLHFVISAIIAYFVRANILASAIGTAVGNPWSFPFIWVWVYNLGHWMGAGSNGHDVETVDFPSFFGAITDALLKFDMVYLGETAWPVFWPMFVGSLPTFVVVWLVFFVPLNFLIAGYQERRRRRMMGQGGDGI